jgi:hypothetical protein
LPLQAAGCLGQKPCDAGFVPISCPHLSFDGAFSWRAQVGLDCEYANGPPRSFSSVPADTNRSSSRRLGASQSHPWNMRHRRSPTKWPAISHRSRRRLWGLHRSRRWRFCSPGESGARCRRAAPAAMPRQDRSMAALLPPSQKKESHRACHAGSAPLEKYLSRNRCMLPARRRAISRQGP